MKQRILANLGFLLQAAGLLTLLPIGVGFIYNETQALIPLFITCVTFLGVGFILNALCERKDLNVKSSSTLLFSAFIILPLIGSIPYLFIDPFNSPNPLDLFSNSYFETVSGFTTTGFSFIENTAIIPKSLLVFRSLTELMGGVGIVFLVLAFFQSKRALPKLGGVLGIEKLGKNLKKMFFYVFSIYSIYIIVFTGLFYAMGYTNVVATGSFVIDTVTGGYTPTTLQLQQYLSLAPKILMTIMMLIGSINFAFNYYLLTGKFKKLLSQEVTVFLGIILFASITIVLLTNVNFLDSLFHVVSLSSTAGTTFLNISSNANVLSILTTVMLIGGCAFSMAGGIKIARLLTLGTSVGHSFKLAFTKTKKTKNKNSSNTMSEALPALASILLFITVLIVFSLLFSTIGVSFQDALFEVGSALSTTGATLGAVSVTMPAFYKWLIIAAMTIGKVEILTIITVLTPITIKKLKRKTIA